MYEYLSAIDPDAAERIHPNNTRKVVRAIEAFETGTNVRDLDNCRPNTKYDFRFFGLNMERERLYERINKRVITLIKMGLIDEVKALKARGLNKDTPSMKAIGYKEVLA